MYGVREIEGGRRRKGKEASIQRMEAGYTKNVLAKSRWGLLR